MGRDRISGLVLVAVIGLAMFLATCTDDKSVDPNIPVLELSADSLAFSAVYGQNPSQLKIVVSNAGGGDMTFTATNSESWLDLFTGSTDTVFATVSVTGLAAGVYYDTVVISSPEATNSPQSVPVTLEILESIEISPSSLIFTALKDAGNPEDQVIQVNSLSSDSISYDIASLTSWIQLSDVSYSAPDTLTVSINATGLDRGVHSGQFTITELGGTANSYVVTVDLYISSWSQTDVGITDLRGVFATNPDTAWIAGYIPGASSSTMRVYRQAPPGSYPETMSNITQDTIFSKGMTFASDQYGWVALDSGRLLKSDDGGQTWNIQNNLPLNAGDHLWDVAFSDERYGWAVGNYGRIVRTEDSGATWTQQSSGTGLTLTEISAVSATHAWTCGLHGNIFRTTDGGATWIPQSSGTTKDLYGIHFVSLSEGWAAGADGTVLQTTDGGATWTARPTGTNTTFYDIWSVVASQAWVSGADGVILRTDDNGANWVQLETGTGANLFDIYFVDQNRGWVVGDSGIILQTENGGL